LVCVVALPVRGAAADKGAPRDEPLRQELLRRAAEDQEARRKWQAWWDEHAKGGTVPGKPEDVPVIREGIEIDRRNTARMKEIVARHGWPGIRLVGEDGANAAWLLVQHADQDPVFQKPCLGLMEEAARKGDASKRHLAYLTDRVLVAEKKKQRYGTQLYYQNGQLVPQPIEDVANVDKRRAGAGLEPLAEYLRFARGDSSTPPRKK
jgi:hypothetical protein